MPPYSHDEAEVRRYLSKGHSVRDAARQAGASRKFARRVHRDWQSRQEDGQEVSPIGDKGQGGPTPPDDRLLDKLRRTPMTIETIAGHRGGSVHEAEDWVKGHADRGLNLIRSGSFWRVERDLPTRPFGLPTLDVVSDGDNTFTLGAMGDTHLGSKYERLDVLNGLYDQYRDEGVSHVFHAGNWIDGEARFNKHDLHTHGMDAQVRYLVDQYPARKGINTYAVAGDDHEGWYCQQVGVDIGRYAENAFRTAGRADWTNLGYMEAFVRLVNRNTGAFATLHVLHPGGGSAYALSYTVQKIVESYGGGEKPAVLFAGHYHKMEKVNIRNVWCVQTGCTQDQTPFMRKKRLDAHVGGHVVRLRQDPKTGAIVEMDGMKRYFNVGYYNGQWSMSGPVKKPRRTLGGVE